MPRVAALLFALAFLAGGQEYDRASFANGVQDTLQKGELPNRHLQVCGSRYARETCLELLVFWGRFQVNRSELGKSADEQAETARGWQFLTLAFQELNAGLKKDASRLAVHAGLDVAIDGVRTLIEKMPATTRDAALDYYLAVWDLLPARPGTLPQFRHKFVTGEQVKFLLRRLTEYAAISGSLANRVGQFYQQAFVFHQLPLPGGDALTRSPGWKATVHEQIFVTIDAYVPLPGSKGVAPHRLLAHTDLEELLLLQRRMADANGISKEALAEDEAAIEKEKLRLLLDDLTRWFDLAVSRGDREDTIETGLKITALEIAQGKLADAQLGLGFIRDWQKELGDLPNWAKYSVALATHHIKAERWKEARAILEEALPVLRDVLDGENLNQALQYTQFVREKLGLGPQPPLPLDVYNKSIEYVNQLAVVDELDRGKRRDRLRELLAVTGVLPYARLVVAIQLLDTLQELRQVDDAARLAAEWLPEARRWRGVAGEVNFRHALLENDIDRGDLGRFYESLAEYEKAARKLRGENWLQPTGLRLARVFFALQDFRRAGDILTKHMKWDEEEALRDPRFGAGRIDSYHYQDLLLEARIALERGNTEAASDSMRRLEAWTEDPKTGVRMNAGAAQALALELAQVNSALGRRKEALAKVREILKNVSPLGQTKLWTDALIEEGRLALALGEPGGAHTARMEEIAANLAENPELGGESAPDIDLFLADFYVQQGNPGLAAQRLERALRLSARMGLLDPQIIGRRKRGELAAAKGDLAGAIGEYRESIRLLDSVSQRIPSDIAKVGYRGDRNRALPLLVEALYDTHRRGPSPVSADAVLDAIEDGKARALSELLFPGRRITQAATRAALPADTAVLEFYLPEGSQKVFRVVMDRSAPVVDLLAVTQEELGNRVAGLIKEMTAVQARDESGFRSRAAEFARSLLPAEWARSFDGIPFRRLYIVPAGPLHQFPFAVLVDAQGRYLDEAENLEIAELPSAGMIERATQKAAPATRSASFVGPECERSQHEVLQGAADIGDRLRSAIQRWRPGEFSWEEPLTAAAFLEKARALDNVFLYAHARFLPGDPVNSYIRFAGAQGASTEVTAADLLQTRIGGGLWVLAACSTGGGRVRSGDEVLGLPRALLAAGARMVVISLWDIDAETSLETMARFYEKLAGGASVAAALRDARGFARKAGLPPYDWAPFVLIGQHGFGE